MKTRNCLAVLSLLLVSSLTVCASEKAKQVAPRPALKAKASKASKPEKEALTGSYIKRNIRRSGLITDGPNPVYVLDNESIRNSGAADLRQLLVLKGVNR